MKSKGRDLRDDMWQQGPAEGPQSSHPDLPQDVDHTDIVRPTVQPLAEGQTSHQ